MEKINKSERVKQVVFKLLLLELSASVISSLHNTRKQSNEDFLKYIWSRFQEGALKNPEPTSHLVVVSKI